MSVPAMMTNPAMIYAPPRAASMQFSSPAAAGQAASPGMAAHFEQALASGIEKVNQEQVDANTQVQEMVSSQGANIHEAMIALSRAEITLRLGVKVGQKLVGAYQELQRIQI